MGDPAVATIIQLVGAAVLLVVTAVGSTTGGAEGAGHAAPVRLWILLHALAGGAAGALAGVAGAAGGDLASWALFGAAIGTAQWIALRAAGRTHPLWVPAAIAGWLPFALYNTPFTWVATGALAAALQALLCRRVVASAPTWILAGAFAWPIAGTAGLAVAWVLLQPLGFALAWVVGWTVVGLIGGLVTAIVLRPALMEPPPAAPS